MNPTLSTADVSKVSCSLTFPLHMAVRCSFVTFTRNFKNTISFCFIGLPGLF